MESNMMGCDHHNNKAYCHHPAFPSQVPEKAVTATSADGGGSRSDAGAWGLRSHYDVLEGRAVGHCTESLGSESMFDDGSASEEDVDVDDFCKRIVEEEKNKARCGRAERGKPRRFPPPLPSLLRGGSSRSSCSFMKVQREDRRLVLTEFSIRRPEIFHAERKDGRLQLHLVARPGQEILEARRG